MFRDLTSLGKMWVENLHPYMEGQNRSVGLHCLSIFNIETCDNAYSKSLVPKESQDLAINHVS